MNVDKFQIMMFVLLLVLAGVQIFIFINLMKVYGSAEMLVFGKDYSESSEGIASGIYFGEKDFYCVSTIGFSKASIVDTDTHEKCHAFVFDEFKHFCE